MGANDVTRVVGRTTDQIAEARIARLNEALAARERERPVMSAISAYEDARRARTRDLARAFVEREKHRDHEITPMEAIIEDNERLGNRRTATLLKGLQLMEAAAGGLTASPMPEIVPARPVLVRVGNRVKIVAHQTPRGLEAFHPERDAMSLPGKSRPQKVHHGSPVMNTIDILDVPPTTSTSAFVGGYGTSFSRGKNVARVYAIPDPPHRSGKGPGVISGVVKKGTKLFDANNDRLSGADFVDMLTKSEIADLQGRLNNPKNRGRGSTLDTIRDAPTIYEAISQITDGFKGAGPRSGANFVTDVFSRRGYDGISYRGSGANERETLLFNPATTFIETERTTTPPLTPKQQDHLLNSIYYPEFPRKNQDAKGGDTRADAKGGNSPGPETAVSETPVPGPAPQAQGGPRIVINPSTFRNKKDALCVAFNEAFRILMEDMSFSPVSEPTDRQREFFSDTAYADDEEQLRRTILARICTFDTSVKDPTDEQLQEAVEFLEGVMEAGYPQNEWEQSSVQRIHDVVERAVGAPPAEEPPAEEPLAEARADIGGGDSETKEEEALAEPGAQQGAGPADGDQGPGGEEDPHYTAGGQEMEEGKVYVDYAKSAVSGGGGLTDDAGGLLGEFRRKGQNGEPDTGVAPLDPGELRRTFRATAKRKSSL